MTTAHGRDHQIRLPGTMADYVVSGGPSLALKPKVTWRFNLQFGLGEVSELAARYNFLDDTEVIRMGQVAAAHGYYTQANFRAVCRWKTVRSQQLVKLNSPESVMEATHIALSANSEALRIWSSMALSGVSWATSSVLLHLAHADDYPILDFRALEALGIRQQVLPNMDFWKAYVVEFRRLLALSGVSKRILDRALWQWSKERGQRSGSESD